MSLQALQTYAAHQQDMTVEIATSSELLVMTYTRLLEHLQNAHDLMQAQADFEEPFSKALNLITDGLQSCLDMERGGEIARNLNTLYDWSCSEMLLAKLKQEPQRLAEVRQVLAILADGWSLQAGQAANASAAQSGRSAPRVLDLQRAAYELASSPR